MTQPSEQYHFGFIIEQALGHITHSRNLKRLVALDPSVETAWGAPEYEVTGLAARLPVYKSNWTVRAGLRTRGELSKIQDHMKRCGADIDALFFHTQTTAAFSQDWLKRYPSIISMDATPLQMDELGAVYDHPRGSAWVEEAKRRHYSGIFGLAKHLVTWSDWAKRGLVEAYGVPDDRVSTLSPGIDPALWVRYGPHSHNNDRVKILFVGGNLERKGGLLLVSAFRKLRQALNTPLELHVVTRDPLVPEEGIFVYHNMQPNSPELIALYHQSDIFCLPTFGDCLSLVLAEAGAAELPAVATDVGGISEVVLDGRTGFIIPPRDEEALMRSLRVLIENPELRARMGDEALKHILMKHNAAKSADHLLAIMKKISAKNGARGTAHE